MPSERELAVVVLAAGLGKRMKSATPKVLHPLCGVPIVSYVLKAVIPTNPQRLLVVVGHGSEQVAEALVDNAELIHQDEQLGTGHAVGLAMESLADHTGDVLVVCGDTPLLTHAMLSRLVETHRSEGAQVTMVTTTVGNPFGYGRVIRGAEDGIDAIVEERDASATQKHITEVNAGVYCFEAAVLREALADLSAENDQGELYLTDVIAITRSRGGVVASLEANAVEVMGINSRKELATAEGIVVEGIRARLMEAGVTFVLPETTYVESTVEIGPDSVVEPNCHLTGDTSFGPQSRIGPGAVISDCRIGAGVTISLCVARECTIEDDVMVGPFCSLRPGTILRRASKAGTFVELKQAEVGEGSKVPHLSYIGDAMIGKRANIGAGTITCNYDGIEKSRTTIDDDAFVGSDTMLIAPVTVGKGAVTGAGSAIFKDVPPGGLGLERSEQQNIEGWASKHFSGKEKR